MSQTLNERLILSKHYNHDPRHFRFPRSMESYEPETGDRLVGWVAVVLGVLLMVVW